MRIDAGGYIKVNLFFQRPRLKSGGFRNDGRRGRGFGQRKALSCLINLIRRYKAVAIWG